MSQYSLKKKSFSIYEENQEVGNLGKQLVPCLEKADVDTEWRRWWVVHQKNCEYGD